MLKHRRAIGDTLSLFAVQLTREGVPADLTNRTPKLFMYDEEGNVKVNGGTCTISNSALAYVEYDFQAVDVNTAGIFTAYIRVYNNSNEYDTYPGVAEGIEVTLFDPAVDRDDLIEAPPPLDILELASAPIRTRTVEGTVEERTVNELVKADQYTASKDASATTPWGIRIARTRPGGMVS
jgi:hypothetical protein